MPGTPATSPIHGAPRYANTDTADFAGQVNAVVDAFDTTAVAYSSGLAASRPATGVNNRWYYATDTRQWSRYTTGGGWETPVPSAHASTHQDGGSDALTVREAMMATGALGLAKGAMRAFRNTAVSPASAQAVQMDAEDFDVSNWHATATGYTPQIAGYYLFTWGVTSNVILTADVYWMSYLRKNGAEEALGTIVYQRGSAFWPVSTGAVVAQANGSTDAFMVGIQHGTGGSAAVMTGRARTFFTAHLIGRS